MKNIPVKNYIILFVVLSATVLLTFYVRSWYLTSKEYYSQNSVIKDIVSEINENEIGNYTLENQSFLLYVSSGKNMEIKDFENNFKKLIEKFDIREDILYLNLDNVDVDSFNNKLEENFSNGKKEFNSTGSTIYVFKDGKITYYLNGADKHDIKQIEQLLRQWGFIGD